MTECKNYIPSQHQPCHFRCASSRVGHSPKLKDLPESTGSTLNKGLTSGSYNGQGVNVKYQLLVDFTQQHNFLSLCFQDMYLLYDNCADYLNILFSFISKSKQDNHKIIIRDPQVKRRTVQGFNYNEPYKVSRIYKSRSR